MTTWNDLAIEGKDALAFAVENKFVRGVSKFELAFDEWPFVVTNRLHELGLIEPFITDSAPDPEYTLYKPTPAGRALLPANGEAVETTNVLEIPMGLTPEEEAWFRREMSAPIIDTTNTANTVASLQADLAAALARAQAAEGEAKELRTVFYVVYDALNQVNQHFRIVEKAYPQAIAFEDMVIALEQTKDFWQRIEPEFKIPSED